jgi:hypothetical protein
MVLTKTAARNKKAVEMYEAGVAAGTPYNRLAYQIKEACSLQRLPLTPRNVPYFTVRDSDFKLIGAASAIMEKYGQEIPGIDGVQLYRFPVIFPLDNWQGNMPHQFACYNKNDRLYWSEYDEAGNRYCMMHAPAEFIGQGQKRKARRSAGGRENILRTENDGICNPDGCPEYQDRACMLTGRFLFYIPGIPGSSAIELPTRSFYALQNARQQMEIMAYITGGRISGTHNRKAMFWISKKNESVSMIDQETGKAKRVSQWIITLEADVDMTKIFEHQEAAQAIQDGKEASAALGYDQDVSDDIVGEFDTLNEADDQDNIATQPAITQIQDNNKPETDPSVSTENNKENDGGVVKQTAVEKIEWMLMKAKNIDEINDAIDLVRGNNEITHDEAVKIRQIAGIRVKEVSQ